RGGSGGDRVRDADPARTASGSRAPAAGVTGDPGALTRAVPLLRCPQCSGPVEAHTAAPAAVGAAGPGTRLRGSGVTGIRCGAGHSFDRARHGYLTLFGPRGRRFPGDTTDQILARERVLGSGVFDTVAGVLTGI